MRKIRVRVVSVLLLISLLLTGCNGWKNYIHTESSLKREAADALEEKYNEEFTIHKVWIKNQTTFYATCSPEDEQDIVFEAQVYKDGSGVYSDQYIQGAVAKQLEERLQPRLETVFEDCFVKVTFPIVEKPLDYYNGVTIEKYLELYDEEHLYIQVFVNMKEQNDDEQALVSQFECFSHLLDEEGIKEGGVTCYFAEENRIDACRDYFKVESIERGGSEVFRDLKYFGFGYDEGIINKTFEQYEEVRREMDTNE